MSFLDHDPTPSFPELPPSHSPLDTHHDHAAALGRLLGHWAYVEMELVIVLQCLLKIDAQKARFVYQEFVSASAKINLLQRLNYNFTVDQSKKEELENLLKTAEKLNGKRNEFIHSLWVETSEPDSRLLRLRNTLPSHYEKPPHKIQAFTPEDIQHVVEDIKALCLSLLEWTSSISKENTIQP